MRFDPDALPVPDLGLRCLRCGYNLAGLPERRCPECGRQFNLEEFIPKGDFPIVIYDGREAKATAEVLDLMKRAAIPVMQAMWPAEGDRIGLGLPPKPEKLGVPRDCYFHAIDLIRQFRQTGERPPMPAPPPPDWTCPSCAESNPGTFDFCWNCSADAPSKA